tara:strand:- start:716 stop:1243 length:528 start_codon:yes stop_codon:yes gene_type:complete
MAIIAEVLFINMDYLKRFTNLNGSVLEDYVTPSIKMAQDKYVQSYLGTDLFDKLKADITAATLAGNYITLMDTYVRDVTVWWTMVELLPNMRARVDNGGLVVRTSEDSQPASGTEIRVLQGQARDNAQFYTKRLIDYLCENSSLFPEYSSNTGADINPTTKAYYDSGFTVSSNRR